MHTSHFAHSSSVKTIVLISTCKWIPMLMTPLMIPLNVFLFLIEKFSLFLHVLAIVYLFTLQRGTDGCSQSVVQMFAPDLQVHCCCQLSNASLFPLGFVCMLVCLCFHFCDFLFFCFMCAYNCSLDHYHGDFLPFL